MHILWNNILWFNNSSYINIKSNAAHSILHKTISDKFNNLNL